MSLSRSFSEWWRRYSGGTDDGAQIIETIQPVVLVADDSVAVEPFLAPTAGYGVFNVGQALTHVGWKVTPGPRGSWIRHFGNNQNAVVSMGIWPQPMAPSGGEIVMGPTIMWGGPTLHRAAKAQWGTAGGDPLSQRQWLDATAVSIRVHGARDERWPDLFIPADSIWVGWHPTAGAQWIDVVFLIEDVP